MIKIPSNPIEYLARCINLRNPFFKFFSREDKIHVAIVQYVKRTYPHLVFMHIPNEGKKSKFEQYKYSIMGSLTGASDFIFLEPKYTYKRDTANILYKELIHHGMCIELKAPSEQKVSTTTGKKQYLKEGILSDAQKEFLARCNKKKYLGICCVGFEESVIAIDKYMQKPIMV